MNKKQLIVAWVVGIWLSLTSIFMVYRVDFRKPIYKEIEVKREYQSEATKEDAQNRFLSKNYLDQFSEGKRIERKMTGYQYGIFISPRTQFRRYRTDAVIQILKVFFTILPVLIIGCLLIYTLRGKKK